jgi:hypothetical protein
MVGVDDQSSDNPSVSCGLIGGFSVGVRPTSCIPDCGPGIGGLPPGTFASARDGWPQPPAGLGAGKRFYEDERPLMMEINARSSRFRAP